MPKFKFFTVVAPGRSFFARIVTGILTAVAPALTAPLVSRGEEGIPVSRIYPPKETGGVFYHWSGVQDERGLLYFGSDVVLGFDGEQWRQTAVPGSREIRALAIGRDGRLWVGGINEIGWFDRGASGELRSYHSLVPALPTGLPPLSFVWQVFPRDNGAVFVNEENVLVWDGQRFVVHKMEGSRRLPAMEVGGEIYISHAKRGLWHLTERGLQPFISAEILGPTSVIWMEKSGDAWLLATKSGLFSWAQGQLRPYAPELANFITKNLLTAACRLPNGDLGIGTVSGGLAIVDPSGRWKRTVSVADGLQSPAVFGITPARDGGVWITSTLGIVRLALDQGVSLFDARRGIASRPINRVTQAGSRIAISTQDGVATLPIDTGRTGRFEKTAAWSMLTYDVTGDDDDLYIGGFRNLSRLHDDRVTTVLSIEQDVLRIHRSQLHPGRLFLTSGFELLRADPAGAHYHAVSLARISNPPSFVCEDQTGTLWIGSNLAGIHFLPGGAPGNPQAYQPVKSVGDPPQRSAVTRIGEAIVLGIAGHLEVRFKPGETATVFDGVPTTPPLHFSNDDGHGGAWLSFAGPFTEGTTIPIVGRLALGDDRQIAWQEFRIPGVDQIGQPTSLFVDDRGIVWLAGEDGLLRLDPAELRPAIAPTAPLIRASTPDGSQLRYTENAVTFDFATLEHGHREALRFQTRIPDSASNWSPPTNNTHLALAALHDGDYEFSARVVDSSGRASPETTWRFRILPPWYRSNLAWVGWMLLTSAGVVGFVSWRSAYLRRRNARLEALVQKKTAQLEKANAAKSEFLANMSHEIRNPISGIVGLSLALEETALDARQKSLSDSIRSCAALLATLVDDVLDFSKIEAGTIDLRPAPFALRASLEQCAAMVKEDLRTSGSHLEFAFAEDLPTQVVGDSARVQQIVLNYLTNAVKFGAGRPIQLGATRAGAGRVRIFVRDRGSGMTAEEAASLFTKFTRLRRAQTENIRGTGLGLAVCRLLALKMGGLVGVESRPGDGALFWVELPLPAADDASASAVPAPAPGPKLRALIVEDIDYNAVAMQAVLRRLDIAADVAATGPDALEKLRHTTYDVVFMDWNLPGMIGTEVAARFRATEALGRRTVIIATTAYSAEFNREACLQSGMDAFIAKPFTPEKLTAALRDLRGSLRAGPPLGVSPVAPPAPPTGEIDLTFLRLLAETNSTGLRDQIDRYLAMVEADVRTLRAATASPDPAALKRLAHRLTQHANLIGYAPLRAIPARIESRAACQDTAELVALVEGYENEFARLRGKLAALRPSTQSA